MGFRGDIAGFTLLVSRTGGEQFVAWHAGAVTVWEHRDGS
jgi:hypothetical protein